MKRSGKTPALRQLDDASVSYELHPYDYHGEGEIGLEAAAALGVEPMKLLKAVILEGAEGHAVALVPSGRRVAPGKLMKALGQQSRMASVAPARAEYLTGYKVGGISPFGIRRQMTVCIDASAMSKSSVYVNAGRRGLMLAIAPQVLVSVVDAIVADIVEDQSVASTL